MSGKAWRFPLLVIPADASPLVTPAKADPVLLAHRLHRGPAIAFTLFVIPAKAPARHPSESPRSSSQRKLGSILIWLCLSSSPRLAASLAFCVVVARFRPPQRGPTYFSLLVQREVSKRKDPRATRPAARGTRRTSGVRRGTSLCFRRTRAHLCARPLSRLVLRSAAAPHGTPTANSKASQSRAALLRAGARRSTRGPSDASEAGTMRPDGARAWRGHGCPR
jgi:hypothetical protein